MRTRPGENPLTTIVALNAIDIPYEMADACLDIDDEFPLHYANGIVQVYDDGNPFSEWLKSHGFKFKDDKSRPSDLAVWGS